MGKGQERAWQITTKPSALKEIKALPKEVQERLVRKIDSLAENPWPRDVKKLKGGRDVYRIAVGDYRVVYRINSKERLLIVERVRHRREVYD